MDIRTVLLVRVSSVIDKVDHPQFFDPSYQLKYIEAGLAKLGDVAIHAHDCWIHPTPIAGLLEIADRVDPDLVVIHCSSFDADVANAFAAGLKARQHAPVVIGIGQGQYLNHDQHLDGTGEDGSGGHYDAILLGEPEEEFMRLFARIRADDGDWREHYGALDANNHRFVVEDLDALPFPSYTREELLAYRSIYPVAVPKRVVWGFLIAGRGCPYGCSFCSEVMRVSIGKKMRVRSGANVVDEMEHLVRLGANIISFQDDSFASSRKLVRSVCDELIRRGLDIPWMARVRLDDLEHDVLELMRDAGCVMLGIGVEVGAQRMIDRVHKTYKPKPWAELARQVFAWTKELGIGTNAYYVLGSPTETREEMEETIRLALELDADSIQVHFHTPYPGSSDWDEYRDTFAGYDPTKMFHYAIPQFSLSAVTPKELVELRSKFYRRYLFRPGFALRHLWKHGRFYLHNPDIFWTLLGIRKIMKTPSDAELPLEAKAEKAVLLPGVAPASSGARSANPDGESPARTEAENLGRTTTH